MRAVFRPGAGFGIAAIELTLRPLGAGGVDLAPVVAAALVGVAQNVECRLGTLEAVLGRLVAGVQVRVQLLGELASRLADIVRRGVALHAEHAVQVVVSHAPLRKWKAGLPCRHERPDFP